MKHIILSLALALSLTVQAASVNISKIEPSNWWAGMRDPSVQLMVYGQGIGSADVTTSYAGIKVDSIVRLDSPNYLLVYLNTRGAQPSTVTLQFTHGKARKQVKWELRQRAMSGDKRMGFTNADVLYMLMPDRFANGDTKNDVVKGMRDVTCNRQEPSLRHGGDLAGIRQHLDYFNELGVTALWLTPVLENDSPVENGKFSTYHGYATTDYYRVDPRFGTNQDYADLVADAHKHGLKVVMDMIFNHCGICHPWLADLPSKDWLNNPDYKNNYAQTSYKLTTVLDPYASQVDKDETVKGWFVPTMPDLNQNNVHLMNYLIQNSIWWVETVGIDGIRMDTYPYAYVGPMARWMKRLELEYPNFNVVGETWVTEPGYTAAWQKDSKVAKENSYLPTVMDFSFFDRLNLAKHEETDNWWKGFNRLYNSFCYDYLYPNPASVMAFIENHDTDRFLANDSDVLGLKQALSLLLTIRRIPQLYYGTEVLMNGTKEVTDGYVRKDFPGGWAGDSRNLFTAAGRSAKEQDAFRWLSALLHWRQGNDLVINGKMTQFIPWQGVYVITRSKGDHAVMTILNGKNTDAELQVARYAEIIGSHKVGTNVITKQSVDLTQNVKLSPRESLILEF